MGQMGHYFQGKNCEEKKNGGQNLTGWLGWNCFAAPKSSKHTAQLSSALLCSALPPQSVTFRIVTQETILQITPSF
jgi:hypothetical protein